MRHIKLYENFLLESDWYQVKQWDDLGQKYTTLLGDLSLQKNHFKYNIGDVVDVSKESMQWDELTKKYVPSIKEMTGQIITVFLNEDTGEFLYGIRTFHPEGATALGKFQEDQIVKVLDPAPDYVTNNPKFEMTGKYHPSGLKRY